jgi:hypothetical protein
MASNTTLNSGTGGDVVATKERTHDGDATKVQVVTLAGVSGTEGAYTFGDIGGDATNGLDVDVTRVIPGTSATHLGKAIDSAAGGTDTGVAVVAVRDDALTTLTPVDGDYVPLRTSSTGALHVNVASGGIAGIADDAAFTPGTSEVLPVGLQADETAPDSVDEGDIGCPRMTLDRKQIVTPRPHASGGLSIFRSLDLDETEEDIKTSAGQLYGYYFANTNASARYLKFYNATAANVTVGSTTPVLTFYLPPTSAGHVEFSHGIAFSTAITAAATTGVADADTGAPGANEVILNAFYT